MTEWEKQMEAGLRGRFGREFRYFREIDSTNRYVQAHIADLPHGTVVLADFQSAGRGRQARVWRAPPQTGLLVSTLVRPGWPAGRAGWLMMIAGLAAVEAIESTTGLRVGLKWPNDIVREREDRFYKLGGILIEGNFTKEQLDTAVIGIGLNANMEAEDLPSAPVTPSSLLLETGHRVDRPALLVAMLSSLEQWYDRCAAGRSPLEAWRKRLITLGRDVSVLELGETGEAWKGKAEQVDDQGQLLVRNEEGELRTLSAADVTLHFR